MPIFHSHRVDSIYTLQFISVALVLELKLALVNMSVLSSLYLFAGEDNKVPCREYCSGHIF